MTKQLQTNLSRRERQIMDIIYRLGKASAVEVLNHIPDPPSYSAVRAMLRVLEQKGHLKHDRQGPRYVFTPIIPHEKAKQSAIRHLLNTFFDGSMEQAVAALLSLSEKDLPPEALERLSRLVRQARKEGR